MGEPMTGRVVEADFEANTLTLEMVPGYYFEPPPETPVVLNAVPRYWWRTEFRKRIAADRQPEPHTGAM